jgi:hypothetical protein
LYIKIAYFTRDGTTKENHHQKQTKNLPESALKSKHFSSSIRSRLEKEIVREKIGAESRRCGTIVVMQKFLPLREMF